MNKFIKIISISILLVSATSCISVRSNKIPEVKDFKLSSEQKKMKIYTNWGYGESINKSTEYFKVTHQGILNKIIEESNCCITVQDKDSADIILEGKFYNVPNRTALVFVAITGLSLFTIPSWATSEIKINATASKSAKTYEYQIEDSMIMAQWLPFIFALPIQGSPIKREKQFVENTYKTLLLKMREDGLFNK